MRLGLALALLATALVVAWLLSGRDRPRAGAGYAHDRSAPAVEGGAESPASLADVADAGDGSSADDTAAAPPLGEPRTFRIVDEAGGPVGGARIDIFARRFTEQPRAAAVADSVGHVRLHIERRNRLVVGAPGFARLRVKNPLRRPDGSAIVLKRGYSVAGVVENAAGVPVPGAMLTIDFPWLPDLETVSDARGAFSFSQLPGEEHTLQTEADGYLENSVVIAPGDAGLRIVLGKPVSIRGTVVFPDGSPAAGAKVGGRATTDAAGRFTLHRGAGTYDIYAHLREEDRLWHAKASCTVTHAGAPDLRIVLASKPRSYVRVRVLDKDGAPVHGAQVLSARTDEEGRARCALDQPPDTVVVVRVREQRQDGLLPGYARVRTHAAGGGGEVVLRPAAPPKVTVVARGPSGGALPHGVDAKIRVLGGRRIETHPDRATFTYDPTHLPLWITASAPGYGEVLQRVKEPAAELEVRLRATGRIRCRLVTADGAAVSKGYVNAWVPNIGASSTNGPGPDGAFVIENVPVGEARVTAGFDEELPAARADVVVRADETVDAGTLTLREATAFSGTVVDTNGTLLGGVRVRIVDESGFEREVFTHGQGKFRMRVPRFLEGHLLARKRGYADAVVPVSAQAAPLVVALQPPGQVRLTVRLGAGPRTRAFSFDVRRPNSKHRWSPEWKRLSSSPQVYELRGLPPGRLVVVLATLPRDVEREVVVVAGQVAAATIEVPE